MEIKMTEDDTVVIHINGYSVEITEKEGGWINVCKGEYGSLESMLKYEWVNRTSLFSYIKIKE